MGNYKTVNTDNFDQEVMQAKLPVLVDFWAPWCGPCMMLGPVVESLADEYDGKISVAKINVDENQSLAAKYGIRGIPTLLFFKDGAEVKRLVGAQGKSQLQSIIDSLI